jgi:hypothetical protein
MLPCCGNMFIQLCLATIKDTQEEPKILRYDTNRIVNKASNNYSILVWLFVVVGTWLYIETQRLVGRS